MLVLLGSVAAAAVSLAVALWRLRQLFADLSALTLGCGRALDLAVKEGQRSAGAIGDLLQGLVALEREVGDSLARLMRITRRVEFLERVAEHRIANALFAISGVIAALEALFSATAKNGSSSGPDDEAGHQGPGSASA